MGLSELQLLTQELQGFTASLVRKVQPEGGQVLIDEIDEDDSVEVADSSEHAAMCQGALGARDPCPDPTWSAHSDQETSSSSSTSQLDDGHQVQLSDIEVEANFGAVFSTSSPIS